MFIELTLPTHILTRMQPAMARSPQDPVDFDWFEYNPNFQQIGDVPQ